MLKINGKVFMNLQEAVQWLLDNNALPFQSSANYIANTEIGMGTIVNPSSAKVRIGSLIFFADSKVSTVTGLTENGFIVSDQYNDLVDDVVYVSNVAINASGHLIVTLSNGNDIDAGLIKQITNFTINASQYLIANYNDGTSTDLGAIFSGNITIGGDLTVVGNMTGPSIIETMTGYSYTKDNQNWSDVYVSACKNGNKLTFVVFGAISKDNDTSNVIDLANFTVPSDVASKLVPYNLGGLATCLDTKVISMFSDTDTAEQVSFQLRGLSALPNAIYYFRIEETFLLSANMA